MDTCNPNLFRARKVLQHTESLRGCRTEILNFIPATAEFGRRYDDARARFPKGWGDGKMRQRREYCS